MLEARRNTDLDKKLRKFRTANYPKYAVYVIVSLIFLLALYNVAYTLYVHLVLRSSPQITDSGDTEGGREEHGSAPLRRRRPTSLRRVPVALLNTVRIVGCRLSVPLLDGSRLLIIEITACVGQLTALLVFEFANSRNIDGMVDPQYYSNRAATLAVSQLAFILALAGKNNVISMLTGISFEKLNILHRSASRTVLLLIWIHMWGQWKIGLTDDHSLHIGWVRSGVVAVVTLTLMVALGTRELRNYKYEFFLASHVILSIIFLVAACIHVTNAVQFLPFVWSACIVWGFDRILRLLRTLRIRYLASRFRGEVAHASVVVLNPDTIRVSLRVSRSSNFLLRFGWRPGQNAYVSIPAVSPWEWGLSTEAHPFTIASLDHPLAEARVSEVPDGFQEKDEKEEVDAEGELEMKFLIRVRYGFTRRLLNYAVRMGGSCSVSAFVDGPYGDPPDVHIYTNVILIAGGSGVSFTMPLLLDLIRRAKSGTHKSLCKKVVFIWFIRQRDHFDGMSEEFALIQRNMSTKLGVDIHIFVTGQQENKPAHNVQTLKATTPTTSIEESATTSKEKFDPAVKHESGGNLIVDNAAVNLKSGRPSVREILEREIAVCDESVAVCVSGPQSLANDVRDALSKPSITSPISVLRGGPSVYLHVEHFGM